MFQPERFVATAWLSLTALCLAPPAQAQEGEAQASPLADKVAAALEAPLRTEAEKERDANRLPAETLAFMRMTPDMRVLELIPGRGWYTKILSQVLAEEGELFVAVGTRFVSQNLDTEPGFAGVKVVDVTGEFSRDDRRNDVDDLGLGVKDIDLALTFRNLHNFNAHGRQELNEAAFAALKPGGHYGVVDHTRRHMQADDGENWRRMDPVLMIKEIESVGFEFVDFTDLHYRADDELRYEVGRKTVTGNTDRFTLLFRKPE
ncbi:MAG: methyltransferase [Pseudomonadota bacterium]